MKILRARPKKTRKKAVQFWATKKRVTPKTKPKQASIWNVHHKPPKEKKPKGSVWVARNPQKAKGPKRSIWVAKNTDLQQKKGASPSYRSTYVIYQLQGNRAKRVKTSNDQREAESWVEDKRVQFPYNAYRISTIQRKRGLF
jgi:hypothetical protein